MVGHAEIIRRSPGGFGVTVFFFLSGYLITTLLIREQRRFGQISLKQFYLRRLIRLSPPLLLTIGAAMALAAMGLARGQMDGPTLASQLLFYYNYFALYGDPHIVEGLGLVWSLSVEEHFYLIWPALFIAWCAGVIRTRHLVLLLGAILAWRFYRVLVWQDSDWVIYFATDTRFDSLLYGCLLAIAQYRMPDFDRRLRGPLAMYAIVIAALLVLLFTLAWRDELFRATWRYSLQGLALMPIFHFAVTRPDALIFRPLNWPLVRQIGVWSYTMYLCHFVILNALIYNGIAPMGSLSLFGLTLLLSCAWSALVYYGAEKPLHPLRRALTQKAGSPAVGLASK